MTIVPWEEFSGSWMPSRPLSATIGVFDGLHIGHQALIRKVAARRPGTLATVFTFHDNPKRLVRPESFKGDLLSIERKLLILEALGVELVVLIDFSGDFSKMPGRNFLSIVWDRGALEYITVGSDFHCGKGKDTDSSVLEAFFIERRVTVDIVKPVSFDGEVVSSTRIREALRAGRIEAVKAMLGRPFEVELGAELPSEGSDRRFALHEGMVLPPPGDWTVTADTEKFGGECSLTIGKDCLVLRGLASSVSISRVALKSLDKAT